MQIFRIWPFPLFDWLHARGLLSPDGTAWDYFVVSLISLAHAMLFLALLFWLSH